MRMLEDERDEWVAPRGYASYYACFHASHARWRTNPPDFPFRLLVFDSKGEQTEAIALAQQIDEIKKDIVALKRRTAEGSEQKNAQSIKRLDARIEEVSRRLDILWPQVPAKTWVEAKFVAQETRIARLEAAPRPLTLNEQFDRFMNPRAEIKAPAIDLSEITRQIRAECDNHRDWAMHMFFSKHDAQAFIDGCFPNAPLMKEIDRHIDARVAAAIAAHQERTERTG